MRPRRTEGIATGRRLFGWTFVIFLGVAALAAADISADLREGTTLRHVVAEGGILLVALLGSAVMAVQLIRTSRLRPR